MNTTTTSSAVSGSSPFPSGHSGEDGNNSGDLDITKSVTIVGKGPGVSIVDGNYLDRVFHIMDNGVAVIFRKMTITRGGNPSMGAGGGGVLVDQGAAVFQHCDIVGNVAYVGGGGVVSLRWATLWFQDSSIRANSSNSHGGGILSNGDVLQIDRSTISQNHATLGGGGLYSLVDGQITDSTISGNYTTSSGSGGVEVVGGNMTLEFCTLEQNSDPTIDASDFGGHVTLGRTIVHGQCSGPVDHFATLGGNLETPGNTCYLSPANDLITAVNPDLGPLGLHGGPTETHRPLPTSLAVDLIFPPGVPDCTRTDQRGFSQPRDASGGVTPRCDIGAVELIHGEIFQDGLECGYTGAWSGVAP